MHDSRPGRCHARDHTRRACRHGALVVECEFPFSPSIHAKENVPQFDEFDENPHDCR